MQQVPARKILTLIAISHFSGGQQGTSLLEEGAVFIPRTATGTRGHPESPVFNVILRSEIAAANPAIHTTRRNQFLVHVSNTIRNEPPFSNKYG